jgi:adenine-specific DNA-methyltransferase
VSFRYIGSKSRLIEQIKSNFGPPVPGSFFVDAFCGTGVVAEAAHELGWNIRLNDNLLSAVISGQARLTSTRQAPFLNFGGYTRVIEELNATQPSEGFITRTYSPLSLHHSGIERRYFTARNAARIDGIRKRIRDWTASGAINAAEERLLIADLFGALNRVANIAGTFGCFLSKWTAQSQDDLLMRARLLKQSSTVVEATVGDVFDVVTRATDVVYLDPPYTKRQYAAYYHILETVAHGDEPVVEGVAGLRPWRHRASDFCYKARALDTLIRLIKTLAAERLLLSYSSEGHIGIGELQTELAKIGPMIIHPLGTIGRYRPNRVASLAASGVNEYLVIVQKVLGPESSAKAAFGRVDAMDKRLASFA